MNEKITVETTINAPIDKVWEAFNSSDANKVWNSGADDWHTTKAEIDLNVGGRFLYRMEAKDGSAGFDFTGIYTEVEPQARVAYTMEDGREAETVFTEEGDSVRVTTTFDPENENPPEMQKEGWQNILNNLKKYVEGAK